MRDLKRQGLWDDVLVMDLKHFDGSLRPIDRIPASGKKLDDTYKLAWIRGLKTTYYLRTQSATHVEKSTVDAAHQQMANTPATDVKFCGVDDPTCESCQ